MEILRAVRRGAPFAAAREHAVAGLSDPDRRLAHEIAAGVLRHRRQLDAQLTPLVTADWRRTPADLKDALRIGAYQLGWLTRVPKHAAVETTVSLARDLAGRKSAGFVNAVLRRLAGGAKPDPDRDRRQTLAQRYSHPEWLVARWVRQFGVQRTEALLQHNNRPARITLEPIRWSSEQLRAVLLANSVRVADPDSGAGLTVSGVRVPALPGYAQGAFIVQDAAQATLLRFAAVPNDSHVWDCCAAPGGKAVVLARRCRLIASDVTQRRMERLRDTIHRTAANVTLLRADARHPPLSTGSMDVILVDAPCTATGTMARHPDARWRLSPGRLRRVTRLQQELLSAVTGVLRPGGLLVYLTCSLEPEENDEQVNRFLQHHPDFTRECDDLFIFPPDGATDGGYGARLRRAA